MTADNINMDLAFFKETQILHVWYGMEGNFSDGKNLVNLVNDHVLAKFSPSKFL